MPSRPDPPPPASFTEVVHAVVRAIPAGEVLTYGEVAAEAGRAGAARAVGTIMAISDGALPWWRVVASNGRLVPGHEAEHTRRLRAEGVELRNGRVAMRRR
jgi:methylated-DNA-protein-cysteine methyltransferase related protein